MRIFLWVWWWRGSHKLCLNFYFHEHILYISEYDKLQCEMLAFPCSWITSFHGFGFNIEVALYIIFIWGHLYEFDDVGEVIYYVIICTFIPICYLSQNPRNSYVKSLHSHAIVSLVFMDFGFNLEVILYQIYMRDILWFGWCIEINIWGFTL